MTTHTEFTVAGSTAGSPAAGPRQRRRPRRSEATRAAILTAARERFAADGYERATIRAIAADARIDPSMVMRYFGSKDRLFAAAADLDLRIPDAAALPPGGEGAALVEHFLDRWEGDEALRAMLRSAATNESAAARARATFAEQVAPVVAALCPEPAQAPVRGSLVASQLLGVALCRYLLRFAPMADLDRAEIVRWLGPTVQRYITGE